MSEAVKQSVKCLNTVKFMKTQLKGFKKVINCELVTQMRGNNTLEYFCQKTDDLI